MIRNNLLYIGIACVLLVCFFLNWVRHQVAYDHIRSQAFAKMGLVEEVIDQPHMPTIKIGGPKGKIVSLPEEGQSMIICLWSVRCAECVSNLKTLKRLRSIFLNANENWEIIGVSIDKPEDLEYVAKAIKKYNLSEFAEYYDANGALLKLAAPKTIPVTLIVSDDGRILYKVYGNAPWLDPDVTTFLYTMLRIKDK